MTSLKKLRLEKGLTQTKMSEILSISVQRYNLYERGKRKLPIEIAKIIALHFEISLEEIFYDENLNNMFKNE